MRSISLSGATGAPANLPEAMQAARIAARIDVSPAVAAVLAAIAFGHERRDHGMLLASLMADRAASFSGASR